MNIPDNLLDLKLKTYTRIFGVLSAEQALELAMQAESYKGAYSDAAYRHFSEDQHQLTEYAELLAERDARSAAL